ncbi:argininosuccinate lyase [Amycolatopsis sp. cmx-11-12]|uniref:argininosuccinate lyase n=1 Tax=Amycolatopsis sp. cmx-11-12 TaxID=2785795 RepID=UPI003916D388
MTDTGRLVTGVSPQIARMLWGTSQDSRAELGRISTVDLAHVVMLTDQNVIGSEVAAELLTAISALREQDFAPLDGIPTPRGLYLAYEGHLVDQLGERVGGVLHTGRSRNDLNATCLLLALRPVYQDLMSGLVRLGLVLLGRARQYRDVVMPAYTHYQAAVPITYGHYLVGVAGALAREAEAVESAARHLDRSPLGAGAVGGTTVPIDPARTARLLGFGSAALNSLDAVASRDVVLRLLASAATLGVVLNRVAVDLLTWSTAEFGLVTVPDGCVGSSSMMPQKRNAFVLEHVQGRTADALGAFTGATAAMRGTPFTNSISVGTEGVSHVWRALRSTTDAITLLRTVISGTKPVVAVMTSRAESGMTTATATAERLVAAGTPFRRAHHEVGVSVRAVLAGQAETLGEAVLARGDADMEHLAAADVRNAADFGGGPGPASFAHAWERLRGQWFTHRDALTRQRQVWLAAHQDLDTAVRRIREQGRHR